MDSEVTVRKRGRILRGASLYLGLAAILIAGSLLEPSFMTLDNQRDVFQRVSINGILAVGMTMVILTAGIDLSVGSVLSLCSVLCAMMVMGRQWNRGNALAIVCAGCAAFVVVSLLARRLFVRAPAKSRPAGGRPTPLRLAVAPALGLAAAVAVMLLGAGQVRRGFGVAGVLFFVPLVGAAIGALSGIMIAKGRLQPFIVTLAVMISVVGLAKYVAGKGGEIHAIYVLSREEQSDGSGLEMLHKQLAAQGKGYASESFASLGRNVLEAQSWNARLEKYMPVKTVPVPGIFFLASVLLAHFVLRRLPFGRYIYAVGGNEEAARFSGINVNAVKIGVYAISGMAAGLAAVFYCAMYGQGKPDAGQTAELDAIAAVVIGGTSLMGGRGKVAGTLVGVLIFGYLSNILVLKGIPSEVQDILKGVIIVAAVLLQEGRIGEWTLRAWRLAMAALRKENGR